jgi:hypothetical protein
VVTDGYVIGGDGKDVVVWDKQSGNEVNCLAGHRDNTLGVTLHPGNPLEFVSFSEDHSFIVWRTSTPLLKAVKEFVKTETKAAEMDQMKEIKATMEELVAQHPVVQVLDAQMHTLVTKVDKMETSIPAEIVELKASVHAKIAEFNTSVHAKLDKMEMTIQSLSKQTPIPNPSHPFQGHLIAEVEQGEFVTEIVDTQGDMVDGTLVIIQQHSSNHFLCYVEADDANLPFGHFTFVETTLDAAKHNSGMQFLMESKDATVTLRSIVYGELVSMAKHDMMPRGAIATAVEVEDASTTLQAIHKDNTLRLIGPRRQHLRLVTITTTNGPYDILASTSILPEPQGLFILYHH